MGLVVRFPLERARAVPPLVGSGEGASILVLPVVSIDRSGKERAEACAPQSKSRSRNGRTTRRRTKRPA